MKILRLPMRRTHPMRGRGLGGIFSRVLSFVKPLLKTAVTAAKPIAKQTLKKLGKTGLDVAASTAADIIEGGVPIKKAVKRNVRKGIKKGKTTLKEGATSALKTGVTAIQKDIKGQAQAGRGKKRQRGRPRGKKNRKKNRGIFAT